MGKQSKTGNKANAAVAKAATSRVAAPKKVSRSMRKLLTKNARKAKNREARMATATPPTLIETQEAA